MLGDQKHQVEEGFLKPKPYVMGSKMGRLGSSFGWVRELEGRGGGGEEEEVRV